jgi:hypothetical protein
MPEHGLITGSEGHGEQFVPNGFFYRRRREEEKKRRRGARRRRWRTCLLSQTCIGFPTTMPEA